MEPDDEGDTTGKKRGGKGKRPGPSSGFNVRHENLGKEQHRGKYVSDRRLILINLDHPEIEAASSIGGLKDPVFIRLSWEVAISEYAVALAQELVDQYVVPDEALFDIRETFVRVSRKLAQLYSTPQ